MPAFAPSVTTSHAVRALAVLAADPGHWRRADDVAALAGVPRPFLAKLLYALGRKHLVNARRGRRGGYRIAAAARRLSLLDVILAVEGDDVFHRCQLGAGRCSARRNCPLHPHWSRERPRLLRLYRAITLERLAGLEIWNLPTRSARTRVAGSS